MVFIDGSRGEGGGQIFRSSLTLSMLTGQPVTIASIRAHRSRPGLQPQHLASLDAASRICDAKVSGAHPGSTQIAFHPGALRSGRYELDIGTAGAASLLLQTVLFPLTQTEGPSLVSVRGGTHVPWSPCYEYCKYQYEPFLHILGLKVMLRMGRAGFYPRGGGELSAETTPSPSPEPLHCLSRGSLLHIRGLSGVANLPSGIAGRQADQAKSRLDHLDCPLTIEQEEVQAAGKGSYLFLTAVFEHSMCSYFGLGERGKPAERVADDAADGLLRFLETDGALDEYLADQLLIPLAWAEGPSAYTTPRVTKHLLTNANVIRGFLSKKIEIMGEVGRSGTVRITG